MKSIIISILLFCLFFNTIEENRLKRRRKKIYFYREPFQYNSNDILLRGEWKKDSELKKMSADDKTNALKIEFGKLCQQQICTGKTTSLTCRMDICSIINSEGADKILDQMACVLFFKLTRWSNCYQQVYSDSETWRNTLIVAINTKCPNNGITFLQGKNNHELTSMGFSINNKGNCDWNKKDDNTINFNNTSIQKI